MTTITPTKMTTDQQTTYYPANLGGTLCYRRKKYLFREHQLREPTVRNSRFLPKIEGLQHKGHKRTKPAGHGHKCKKSRKSPAWQQLLCQTRHSERETSRRKPRPENTEGGGRATDQSEHTQKRHPSACSLVKSDRMA